MENRQKNTKKIVAAVALLLLVMAALFGVYHFTKGTVSQGKKNITVEVFHGDGSEKSFDCETEREYLGEVLSDEGIAEGETGPYGLFITAVDGETANSAKEEWWCITKGGKQLNTGADQTPIADGDTYELTLTTGY